MSDWDPGTIASVDQVLGEAEGDLDDTVTAVRAALAGGTDTSAAFMELLHEGRRMFLDGNVHLLAALFSVAALRLAKAEGGSRRFLVRAGLSPWRKCIVDMHTREPDGCVNVVPVASYWSARKAAGLARVLNVMQRDGGRL